MYPAYYFYTFHFTKATVWRFQIVHLSLGLSQIYAKIIISGFIKYCKLIAHFRVTFILRGVLEEQGMDICRLRMTQVGCYR